MSEPVIRLVVRMPEGPGWLVAIRLWAHDVLMQLADWVGGIEVERE